MDAEYLQLEHSELEMRELSASVVIPHGNVGRRNRRRCLVCDWQGTTVLLALGFRRTDRAFIQRLGGVLIRPHMHCRLSEVLVGELSPSNRFVGGRYH